MESGSGNFTGETCLSISGSNNIVKLTCDTALSGTTALNDAGGYNLFDVVLVGSGGIPAVGTVAATSQARVNGSLGVSNSFLGSLQLSSNLYFGGKTSAYPMVKRNGSSTTAQFRVGDDTSDAYVGAAAFSASRSGGTLGYPDFYGASGGLCLADVAAHNSQMCFQSTGIAALAPLIDFHSVTHTLPTATVATVGSLPSTGCTPGELAVVTGATAGQMIYENTGTGTCAWTQQLNSGGGGSGILTMATGAGAPVSSCTAPSSGNLAAYTDTTNQDLWICVATNIWKKVLSTTNTGVFVQTGATGTSPGAPASGNVTCYYDSTAKIGRAHV